MLIINWNLETRFVLFSVCMNMFQWRIIDCCLICGIQLVAHYVYMLG